MSTDIKLSKAQISKIIQSGGFSGSLLSKLAGSLMKVAVPLAKNILPPLGIMASRNWKKTWFKNNEEMNDNHWHNGNCSSSWRF